MVSLPTGSDDIGSVSGFGANENEMNHFRVKTTRFIFFRKFSFSGFIFFHSDDFKEKSPWQIKKSNETPIPIFFIHNIPWKHHFAWRYDILFCSAWFWFVCVFWLKCMVGIPNTQKMVDVSSLASSSFLIYFADFPVNDLKVNHHCTSLN